MRFPSTPMNVRNRRSDVGGSTAGGSPTAKGDKSGRVGGLRSATGVDSGSRTRTPRGRQITHTRGNRGYQKN